MHIVHLERVQFLQRHAAVETFEIVDVAQGVPEHPNMGHHPIAQAVTAFELLFFLDGVEQALFEQTLSDGGRAFVDETQQCQVTAVFGDDTQLFKGVVAEVGIAAVVDHLRPRKLLDDVIVVFDDEMHQRRQRFGDERMALEVKVLDG